MHGKPWRDNGKQGYTFTDISFGCGWDSSQEQPENGASFTVFGGGRFGKEIARKDKDTLSSDFIPALEQIYPGAKKAYTEKNIKFCWEENPFSKAGYSSFKKGQWSTLAGWEGLPVGNIYFAGEHVSSEFQGYMNGGAQSGRVAAAQIAEKIRMGSTPGSKIKGGQVQKKESL
jgi:monoamine oxidase